MLALVVADGHLVGVVQEDVGGLERRVREQPGRHELALLGRLLLELRHAAELAERRGALHDPAQLGVLVHLALGEEDAALGVEPGGDEQQDELAGLGPQLVGVAGDRQGVEVDDAVDGVALVEARRPAADRAQVVAEVDVTGRLDAGEDAALDMAVGAYGPQRARPERRYWSGCAASSRSSRSALVVAALVAPPPAAAYPGAPWFEPGEPYDDNFPDPSVLYDAATGRYYAYATTTGGAYLPAMSSADAAHLDRPRPLPPAGLRARSRTTPSTTTPCRARRRGRRTCGRRPARQGDLGARASPASAATSSSSTPSGSARARSASASRWPRRRSPLGPFTDVARRPDPLRRPHPNGVDRPAALRRPGDRHAVPDLEERGRPRQRADQVLGPPADARRHVVRAGHRRPRGARHDERLVGGQRHREPVDGPLRRPLAALLLGQRVEHRRLRDRRRLLRHAARPVLQVAGQPRPAQPGRRSSARAGPSAFVDAVGRAAPRPPLLAGAPRRLPDRSRLRRHRPRHRTSRTARARASVACGSSTSPCGADRVTISTTPPPVVTARNIDSACPTTLAPRPYTDVPSGSSARAGHQLHHRVGRHDRHRPRPYNPARPRHPRADGVVRRPAHRRHRRRRCRRRHRRLLRRRQHVGPPGQHQPPRGRRHRGGHRRRARTRRRRIVTRAQMATFLVPGGAGSCSATTCRPGTDAFADDNGSTARGQHQRRRRRRHRHRARGRAPSARTTR